MIEKDKEYLATISHHEGFDYAFCDYSSFDEIEDEEFHKVREEYVKAAEKLKDIIGFDDY